MSTPLVALVTAGSAGLGAATARLFAKSGMRVAINYSSNSSRATALVAELGQISPLSSATAEEDAANFISIQADLTVRGNIARLVQETVKRMGRLDVVFSNGGWTSMQDFNNLDDNVDEVMWDKCWNMNVKSHLWLMHASREYLDQTEGCFVSTASLAGVRPSGSSLVSEASL
jgi:NAD(P)-dependent dehydrogenase (short-subunit alcohol dehydrogenase family)